MPEISKITLPSGTTYDLKDAYARGLIAELHNFTEYLGVTTTPLTNGASTNPIIINGESVTAVSGDVTTYNTEEFIFNGTVWQKFGDLSGLGSLAYKNSASGTYEPTGSVSAPSFTGASSTFTGSFTPSGTVSVSAEGYNTVSPEVTTVPGVANYTPTGTVSQPTFTGTESTGSGTITPTGTVSVSVGGSTNQSVDVFPSSGSATYVPSGSCSGVDVTLNSQSIKYIASDNDRPQLTTTVANETLTIGFTRGTLTDATVATSVDNVTQPTFTGEGVRLVTGDISVPSSYSASFTGDESTVSVSITPSGTISTPTFTGEGVRLSVDEINIPNSWGATFTGSTDPVSVSGTPNGTVGQPTFTGTEGTITVS